jgi:tRNA threonylcarbamoyladenosine biosynthesis protein TsaE
MNWKVENESSIPDVAAEISKFIPKKGIVLFDAAMGSGKTTLIRSLLSIITFEEFQGSPTYSLVNEYLSKQNKPIYHFDLYRLKDEKELFDIGFEDYLSNDSLLFIEWPEKSLKFLPDNIYWVYIRVDDNNHRLIELKHDNRS